MDQTLPTPLSVKTRQNIAAWLLVLTGVLNLTLLFFQYNFLIGLFIGIVNTIAWILLYTTASNKATRTASIIIITLSLISIAKNRVLNSNPSEYYITIIVVSILQSLITIYAYSILLKGNNSINIEDRAWIGFLIISNIGVLIINLFFNVLLLYTNIVDYELFRPYNFINSIGWMLWNIVYYILVMAAEFRMAKCAAFTGNYNSEPASKEIYSPINKYFAATLISAIVVLGLLYVIYNNILSIENIF